MSLGRKAAGDRLMRERSEEGDPEGDDALVQAIRDSSTASSLKAYPYPLPSLPRVLLPMPVIQDEETGELEKKPKKKKKKAPTDPAALLEDIEADIQVLPPPQRCVKIRKTGNGPL